MAEEDSNLGLFEVLGRALAIAVIVTGLGLAFFDKLGPAGVFIPTGFALFLLTHFDKLKGFKLLGLEATLQDTIREAVVTLAKLREVTELVGEASVRGASSIGRWDSASPRRWMHDYVKRLTQTLTDLKVENHRIAEIIEPWRLSVQADTNADTSLALGRISSEILQRISSDIVLYMSDDAKRGALQADAKRLQESQGQMNGMFRSPELMPAHIERFAGVLTELAPDKCEEIEVVLVELRNAQHFMKTGTFLDEAAWYKTE